ncbi:hypothetical protein MBANPS3_003364 [Mucor bainieri]
MIEEKQSTTSSQSTTGDFSVPGYLRTTASSNNRSNSKRKYDGSRDEQSQHQNRRRFQHPNKAVPTKMQDRRFLNRQESRESSVFSIASTVREDRDTDDADEEHFEKVILFAKCLQWEFLNNKVKIAFERKKQAIEVWEKQDLTSFDPLCIDFLQQRELSMATEALKEKRKREAALFKEKNDMLDDRDVQKYVQQAQNVADRMQEKIDAKNHDLVEEKKELAVILSNMNDLTIPLDSVHESIHELSKTQELLQKIIDLPDTPLK